jgi:phage tail-like protein
MASPPKYFSAFRFQVTFSVNQYQRLEWTETAEGFDITATSPEIKLVDAGFSDVQGLEANIELKAHPEGGLYQGVRQLTGRSTYTNIVLKRGMSRNFETWVWFTAVARGIVPVARKSVTIELLDNDPNASNPVARWNVFAAIPVKMKVSDFNAKSGELAIEELHLAHEGWELDLSLGENPSEAATSGQG